MYYVDGIPLRAGNLAGLVSAVHVYHSERGGAISLEDVGVQVVEQLCSRNPNACRNSEGGRMPVDPKQFPRIAAKVERITNAIRAGNHNLVSAELAAERAAICKQCRYHTPLNGPCRGCSEELQQVADASGRSIPGYDKTLRACSYYTAHAGLQAVSLVDVTADAPAGCWRKRT